MHIFDFCKGLPRQSFDAGEIILREGEKTERLYILETGWVEISQRGLRLNKVTDPGAIFGEVSALLNAPHMATVIALERSDFFVVENAGEFIRDHPDVSLLLARLLAQRLTSITAYLSGVRQSLDTLLKLQTGRRETRPSETVSLESTFVLSCGVLDRPTGKSLHRAK
jgi:CRP/FNR family transcriptional regulator, cyclic AMP receptor protein